MYNAHWQVTCGCGVASAQSCYTEVSGYSLADFYVVSVPVRMVALLCAPSANTTIRSRDMMAVRLEPNHGLRSCENDATVEAHRKLDAKSSSFAVILDSCGLIARPTIPGKFE